LAFGLAHDSEAYRELMDSAYKDRFGSRTAVHRISGGIVSIELEEAQPSQVASSLPFETPTESRGLGGLPPELTPPDSNAGKYHAAFRNSESETVQPVDARGADRDQEQPPWATGLFVLPELVMHEVIDFMFVRGIQLTRFEQEDEGVRCDFKLPNGAEYELRIRPKNPPIRGAMSTDAKQGD
jgi:hypothetical protein